VLQKDLNEKKEGSCSKKVSCFSHRKNNVTIPM
jgi:hypothetical protein